MRVLDAPDLELTEAEKLLDQVLHDQRMKGRRTYGTGLDWRDGAGKDAEYNWLLMGLEESVDLNQYLCAELLRRQYEIRHLNAALDATEAPPADIETLRQYESAALRTIKRTNNSREDLAVLALGLSGEAGEVTEMVKKYLGHGHDFDRKKLEKELGDVLWYVATLANTMGLSLSGVAQTNITKLRERYPEGFSDEASRNRTE